MRGPERGRGGGGAVEGAARAPVWLVVRHGAARARQPHHPCVQVGGWAEWEGAGPRAGRAPGSAPAGAAPVAALRSPWPRLQPCQPCFAPPGRGARTALTALQAALHATLHAAPHAAALPSPGWRRQYPRTSVWHRVKAPIKSGQEAVLNGDFSFGWVWRAAVPGVVGLQGGGVEEQLRRRSTATSALGEQPGYLVGARCGAGFLVCPTATAAPGEQSTGVRFGLMFEGGVGEEQPRRCSPATPASGVWASSRRQRVLGMAALAAVAHPPCTHTLVLHPATWAACGA